SRPVPVWNRKGHSRLGHKIDGITQISSDPRRRLATLFHLNTSNRNPTHRPLQQIRLQHSTRETVTCRLHNHWLIRPGRNEINQLEETTVTRERLITVCMQKVHNGKMSATIRVDKRANILLERQIVPALPTSSRLERILSINNQERGLGNWNLRRIKHA